MQILRAFLKYINGTVQPSLRALLGYQIIYKISAIAPKVRKRSHPPPPKIDGLETQKDEKK